MTLMRWGEWPPWMSITMRTLQLNPSVRFLIFGDSRPPVAEWPANCEFHHEPIASVLKRVRSRLGTAPPSLSGAGSTSKISDFKPLLGALYPDLLAGCAFWGYMQVMIRLPDNSTPATADTAHSGPHSGHTAPSTGGGRHRTHRPDSNILCSPLSEGPSPPKRHMDAHPCTRLRIKM